jgi:thiol:disulfide interchange protein DsbD
MVPIEETLVTLPMAIGLGLVFGLSSCTLTCLPYLAPVFLARGGGIRQSWRTLLPFSLGRLTVYAGFSTLAGLAGQLLDEEALFDKVRWVMGVAAIIVGIGLLLRRSTTQACTSQSTPELPLNQLETGRPSRMLLPGGLFLMGIGIALTPCMPLGSVLLSAATVGDALHGLALGLGFGLGAIAIPSLVYGVGFAHLGSQLREKLDHWRPHIARLGALLLIVVGGRNLIS